MDYTTLKTSELREGMIVNCYGLRCLIDRPINSRAYEADRYPAGTVYWSNALILNRDEVTSESVPLGWTTTKFYPSRGLPAEPEGTHRWTIQGNDLVRWSVEPDSIQEAS